MKYLILTICLLLLTGCQSQMLGLSEKIPDSLILKASKDKILVSQEVDWIEDIKDEDGKPTGEKIDKGKMIKYDYVSDVEVKNDKDEEIQMRTGNSKHFKKEIKDGKQIYEGKFYVGTPFIKQDDKWYHSETATTSIEAFEEQTKPSLISRIKNLFIVMASELTPVYSGAGDGIVSTGRIGGWDTAHDGTSGTVVDYTSTQPEYGGSAAVYYNSDYSGEEYIITRTYLPFDTSELPNNSIISGATLKVYVFGKSDAESDGYSYVSVVETFQASSTVLVLGDYEDCGSDDGTAARAKYTPIEKGSDDLNITSDISISAYNTWTLNATGLGWISKTGYTKLGLREGHDIEDVDVTNKTGDNHTRINIRASEYLGTTSDPYLSITYSIADSCTAPASGDWTVNLGDDCYVTADTYVIGDLILIDNTGTGCLNIIDGANLQVDSWGSTSTRPYICIESDDGSDISINKTRS